MIDVKSFIKRKGVSKADLCRELEIDPKSSLMSSYEKGRSNPSYEKCEKLIRFGISAKELFGEELGGMLLSNSMDVAEIEKADPKEPIDYNNPIFLNALEKGLQVIEERKKKAGESQ